MNEIQHIQTVSSSGQPENRPDSAQFYGKGNVFPLRFNWGRMGTVNRRLTEFQIRSTCRELVARDRSLSGRRLRKALKERFGAVGKTERVFEFWRQEIDSRRRETEHSDAIAALPVEIAELQRRLQLAETAAAENLNRAELAEYRERAHQDHWAVELDRLRQEVESLRQTRAGQGASLPFPV